jgi:hypothetical protein
VGQLSPLEEHTGRPAVRIETVQRQSAGAKRTAAVALLLAKRERI